MPLTKGFTSKRELMNPLKKAKEQDAPHFAQILGVRRKKLRGAQKVPMNIAAINAAFIAANS